MFVIVQKQARQSRCLRRHHHHPPTVSPSAWHWHLQIDEDDILSRDYENILGMVRSPLGIDKSFKDDLTSTTSSPYLLHSSSSFGRTLVFHWCWVIPVGVCWDFVFFQCWTVSSLLHNSSSFGTHTVLFLSTISEFFL